MSHHEAYLVRRYRAAMCEAGAQLLSHLRLLSSAHGWQPLWS